MKIRHHLAALAAALAAVVSAACHRNTFVESNCEARPRLAADGFTDAPDAAGAVAGTIVDEEDGRGVQGAVVQLDSSRRQVFTDAAGNFRIDTVTPGHHRLAVRRIGYARRQVDVTESAVRGGVRVRVTMSRMLNDGCGFGVVVTRRPWWGAFTPSRAPAARLVCSRDDGAFELLRRVALLAASDTANERRRRAMGGPADAATIEASAVRVIGDVRCAELGRAYYRGARRTRTGKALPVAAIRVGDAYVVTDERVSVIHVLDAGTLRPLGLSYVMLD